MSGNLAAGHAGSVKARVAALEARITGIERQRDADQACNDAVCIVCFSGEWDRLFAALTIAAGALALGQQVHLFFTFWSVGVLRDPHRSVTRHGSYAQSLLARILAAGPGQAPLSKFGFWGLGKAVLRREMSRTGVPDAETLFSEVRDLGAHIHVCESSARLFGLEPSELRDGGNIEICGVATFLSHALASRMTLFI